MISAFLLAAAFACNAQEETYYADTTELLGIVALWPRENVLVFENQLVRIDSDAIDLVLDWSETHVWVKDVFGASAVIDIRKIERVNGDLWNSTARSDSFVDGTAALDYDSPLLMDGAPGGKPSASEQALLGIGPHRTANRFYSLVYDEDRNVTEVKQEIDTSRAGDSQTPLKLTLPGACTPIFIRDEDHYIYLGDSTFVDGESTRFGDIVVQVHESSWKPFKQTLWFLPLRTRER